MAATSLNLDPHSKDLPLGRVTDVPATFFVTKSIHPKKPILEDTLREVVASALSFALEQNRIHLRAFVVMPDHWHALLQPIEPWTLPKFMHAIMTFIGRRTGKSLTTHETAWQDGYYDTRIKSWKQLGYVTRYIEENPVTKGLVMSPEEWPQSSAFLTRLVTSPWPADYS